jgi:glutathione S-transferase
MEADTQETEQGSMFWSLFVPFLVIAFSSFIMLGFKTSQLRSRRLVGARPDTTIDHTEEYELLHNGLGVGSVAARVCLFEKGIDFASHELDTIATGRYATLTPDFLDIAEDGLLPVLLHNGHPVHDALEILMYIDKQTDNTLTPSSKSPAVQKQMRLDMDEWLDIGSRDQEGPLELTGKAGSALAVLSTPLFVALAQNITIGDTIVGMLFNLDRMHAVYFLMFRLFGPRILRFYPIVRAMSKAKKQVRQYLDELELHLSKVACNAAREAGNKRKTPVTIEDGSDSDDGPEELVLNDIMWICGEQFSLADVRWMAVLNRIRQIGLEQELLQDGKHQHLEAYWLGLQTRPSFHKGVLEFVPPCVVSAMRTLATWKKDNRIPTLE